MNAQVLYLPPFRLDFSNSQLWRGEQLVRLHPKAWAILRYLIEQKGRTVSSAELYHGVWQEVPVRADGIKVHINEIRKALGDDPRKPKFVETVQRKGYRFITSRDKPEQDFLPPLTDSQAALMETKPADSQDAWQPITANEQQKSDLVGRTRELDRLYSCLNIALTGQRQLVFVSGEPGLGKTALVRAFQEQLATTPHVWVTLGRCVEHYGSGEAYLPVLDALEQLQSEAKLSVLVPLLQRYAPTWLERLPSLLTLGARNVSSSVELSITRDRMLREFARAIEALTVQVPLVLILEDLHWSDYSTLDLLSMLAQRQEPARLLVIGTYRPEEIHTNQHPLRSILQELHAHRRCHEIMLTPLSEEDVNTYLTTKFPIHIFPSALTRVLRRRTMGNPLFLTNLTETLIDRGSISSIDEKWTLTTPLTQLEQEVPESFRLLLERQSASLTAKEQQLLSAASVIGLEFSAAAVAAILESDVVVVEEQCEKLARRRQFLRPAGASEWPNGERAARYAFHHALLREAWSTRVSPARQQRLHLSFSKRLEIAYLHHEEEVAAELAMHFTEGRDLWRAIHYHNIAGEKASRQLAYQEAIAHFSQAVTLLDALPRSRKRSTQEVHLHLALAIPLITTKGWAASETRQAYARAHELSRQVGSLAEQFATLFGLWVVAYTRAELRTAYDLAQQLFHIAKRSRAPTLRMKAHHTLGNTLHRLGQLPAAREHLEQGVQLYLLHQSQMPARRYGLDDGVAGLGYLAWVQWALGYANQAQKTTAEMLTLARTLAHPLEVAWALNTAAWHAQFHRAAHTAQHHAEEELSLSKEHGFAQLHAVGTIVKGWTYATLGHYQEGIQVMEDGITAVGATGATIGRPRYLTALAETYGKVGQIGKARTLLSQAEKITAATEERFYEAELHRLRGELTVQQSQAQALQLKTTHPDVMQLPFHTEAQKHFRKAIVIARRQNAKIFELRATVSLARLLQQEGKRKQALQQLQQIYDWFTEGLATIDLQEARALLDELEESSADPKRALPIPPPRRAALATIIR
jgi:DNA-binding winged helix-turn-helix (wHTH) protein/predicted ATPase